MMFSGAFDPRAKFCVVILAVAATCVVHTLWGLGILAGVMLLIASETTTPFRRIVRNIALMSWLLIMTGGLRFWGIVSAARAPVGHAVIVAGVMQGIVAVAQLAIVVGWVSVFNASSSPLEIVTGLEQLLKPCRRIGLPVSNISTVAMMTLRFLPIFIDEAQQLRQTLTARGIDWHTETWFERAKQLVFLCVPLFNSLLRRVESLTLAMENRDFAVGAARTSLYARQLSIRDYVLLSGGLVGFVCCALIG